MRCATIACLLPYLASGFGDCCDSPPPVQEDVVLIPTLEGLTIIGGGCPSEDQEFCHISFRNFDLPGLESALADVLTDYIGSPLTESGLSCLKEAIARFFQEQGRPVVLIQVPEQEVTHNRLHIQIIESKLGCVRVCNNKWFSSAKLVDQVRLCENEPINSDVLADDLRWLSRNPFREVDAIFSPGKQPYTTDVELLVRDRFPVRLFTGADNTGIPITGRTRYIAGLQASNFFRLDHILTYQFSTGNRYEDFHSHFLQYSAPLSWRHILDLYGAYARTEAEKFPFRNEGNSYLGSARYTIPIKGTKAIHVSEFALGFDFKRTNNNLLFSDHPIFAKNVNLTQFVASGRLGYRCGSNQYLLNGNLYYSPCNISGDDGSRSHFERLRPGANNRYAYFNGGAFFKHCFARDFSWTIDLRGQVATTNLLPSEQFGLGGYNTVRGYDEHQINKDNALLLNTEIRTPSIALFDRYHLRCYNEGLQFLAFLDYGLGVNHEKKGNLRKYDNLAGIGPGIRYVIEPYVTFRFDWGIQLSRLIEEHKFKSRVHFALYVNLW